MPGVNITPPPPEGDEYVPQANRPAGARRERPLWQWMAASSAVTAVLVAALVVAVMSSVGSGGTATASADTRTSPTSAPVRTTTRTTPPPTTTVAPPPPAPAREISSRDWQKIARDPGSHFGESIVVHGHITQFDSGTGLDTFRANVDGVRQGQWYDYQTNTLLTGERGAVADLVQGDLFRAEVVVGQAYTYTNTMGGSTTVPTLVITSVTRTGSAD
ncbi:hypothetical protein GCM10009613_11720 [Pseudonocardia kongjuensis]|uniref:DUF5666 domain-containing protein n=1 Tax=Pseudonocardia kongjuensis TaxID=102227 RepID=A0ABN1XKT5_9PSEU